MMLGEECASATYWKKCGDDARARGIKGVVMMGAHWDCLDDKIQVATNPDPQKSPVSYVDPAKYQNYKLNPDIETGRRCVQMLKAEGFDAEENPKFDWIHDVFLILIRMFPDGCPPTTIISMNARYDPHFHMKIGEQDQKKPTTCADESHQGATIRPLRKENYLIVGSGGAVHNLYRNIWAPMIKYRDNFAMETPPGTWALEFRQAVSDVITNNSGPKLRRAMTRMMKHPQYRDAHGTDDHFMSAMFVSGAAGDEEDEGSYGKLMAEDWELVSTMS